MLKVKTDVKWNTKLLEPDTKGCVLHNLSLWTKACPKGVNWLQVFEDNNFYLIIKHSHDLFAG